MAKKSSVGGVIHVYQKYDPLQFPSPTTTPPDLVSPAMEHALMYGQGRTLSAEELARAIRLDPSQIAGFGPAIESIRAILEERKRKILAKYETDSVEKKAKKNFIKTSRNANPPDRLRVAYRQAIEEKQIYDLERIWYRIANDHDPFARQLVHVIERLSEQVQIESLISKYTFTGQESMTVPEALEIKKELEEIDKLLRQLAEAEKNAQIALIDMEALSQYIPEGDMSQMEEVRKQIEQLMREIAEQQGISSDGKGGFELTPQAMRIFQGRLLEKIFSHLQPSRSGRHTGRIIGDGAVELPSTKGYEFGDSLANMDVTQSVINAMLKRPQESPTRLRSDDIEVHRTRNSPKCGTVVIMDMSGSMRHDGQYVNVKRMALALQGLITREYPGDFLRFIEMYTFAKVRPAGEIINMLPKRVTIHDPWVRLRVDMSRDDIGENQIHPHFTNIQHALQLARQHLATIDTPNRQIVLITDGLPTAHFEGSQLYMLYPPDPRTESATLREGMLCQRDGIVINMFLLPSWSQTEDDIRFSYRLAESTRGRVFFTAGRDLDRFVVWDYVQRKREII